MAGMYDTPEMVGVFLDEVEDQLQLLEQNILELEQKGENTEVIQNIFRAAHTLKGASAAMGFEKMKILTHEMENVLDKIRNNQLKTTKPVIDILFQCLDYLKILKEDFIHDKNEIKTDISTALIKLKSLLSGECVEIKNNLKTDNKVFQKLKESDMPVEFALDLDKMTEIEQATKSGLNSMICKVTISKDSIMKTARACLILNYFNEIGTVIATEPNVLEIPDDVEINEISYLLVTKLNQEIVESKAINELMDVDEVKVYSYQIDMSLHKRVSQENIKTESGSGIFSKTTDSEKKISHTLRVDVERLEKMMNLVGELLIEQTRIAQVGNTLHNRYASDNMVNDLLGISNHISRVISELQEGVMKTRMLPVQQLFNRFPRMVRDLAESLNKKIELVIEGGETEMDKTIIEDITDPLIHLIRNAVDHGIETPEERIKAGKSPNGILHIKAFYHENNVVLTIEDDGRGINLQKIKESAVKKQIITVQEAELMSEQEIINLIFRNGFSTSNKVNEISGRGVGMDIVKNHVDKLNGIIEVETKPGKGTKFIIKLPLTLAILTGLLVKISDETYVLPMSNILEIVRKNEDEIESVKGQKVAVIRGKVLPLIWVHDYFNIPRVKSRSRKNVFIVILGIAEKRIGLIVDELLGNQEIVVKPLGAYIGKIECFSGATILGDGNVACILDVAGIAKMISN